jgi:hypothetical protein
MRRQHTPVHRGEVTDLKIIEVLEDALTDFEAVPMGSIDRSV